MIRVVQQPGPGLYDVVDERIIARDMSKTDAERIAELLNSQPAPKTPTLTQVEENIAATRKKIDSFTPKPIQTNVQRRSDNPTPGWKSLRFNGQPIDPISGEPLLSCDTCHQPIKGTYATIGGNWVPPIAPKCYHLGCIPPIKAAAEEQQAAINRKLDKVTTEADQVMPGYECPVCETMRRSGERQS